MKIPLFDLDGTLLQSGRGNKPHQDAFSFAFKTVYNLPTATFLDIVPDGMIDPQILAEVALLHGVVKEEAFAKVPLAVDAMAKYFILHTDEEPSKPHQGAKALLEYLTPLVHCGVLTGNIEVIGWEKLRQAGLKEYIAFGAFGDMGVRRVDLIPIAQKKYKDLFHEQRPLRDFVIVGDTPKDIICAREGGIPVIAVPTGNYSAKELKKEHPDLLVESLEEKEKIVEFLQA